ncbi:thioredoxin family protein [Arcticibacter sp.]|uniref:thioredoxin family protein n=1 Tax=Arcticibacter sp. TaxID=1872630 RepID=UPI00388F4DFB
MKKVVMSCFLLLAVCMKLSAQGYTVGSVVEDFRLKNVDDKMVSLADFKSAKGFILVFTCNTCPVAKDYENRIVALNDEYAAQGYPVIAINTNDPVASPGDSFGKMQERAKEKNFKFPYLVDADQQLTKRFGAAHTPTVYILSKTAKGNVVEYTGAIDNDQDESNPSRSTFVKNAVNELMNGKKPSVSKTKAVGCTVKWKKA